MSTVLYVTAHPLDKRTSYSLSVGNEFIQTYRELNPNDEVIHLDLYKMNIPQLDAEVLSGWSQLRNGSSFEQLSSGSQTKVARLSELIDQFLTADKIVVVNPVWNFLFPPVLKAYIDAICVAGKTFSYTPNGIIGLASDKKLLHIQASGSVLSQGPAASFEFSHRYLTAICKFIGIPSIEVIYIEGTGAEPDKAPTIKEKAIQRALELARSF
ncbi:FMN-dependent NADH-azoreductase [Paenibacillus sp. CGMCC 1.16610]|uniref:FMN dependent NADH:quinone oxidoreductase n=1 Tax=Paenibacillus anseongense TaxID=2682845 RepID=A0ABW9UJN1_9BACL|nr:MULTISPECIES: FMN-dependent NADH-azoreductase [Paenibacillus]MBA2939827.1 FMN-dependent NADH-azoreductase [Paenibacillus sp. CGMCC 1.16610]MVQ39487.1 FMN-dependent NADH-azoreductase [Paenibacillus anseongense]